MYSCFSRWGRGSGAVAAAVAGTTEWREANATSNADTANAYANTASNAGGTYANTAPNANAACAHAASNANISPCTYFQVVKQWNETGTLPYAYSCTHLPTVKWRNETGATLYAGNALHASANHSTTMERNASFLRQSASIYPSVKTGE
ncbi:hypothetical protein FACS1894111_02160 [Clostridia bacterium]|nr:hypothetical protein FACS1894111_02160 [Clostridia bacterium]